MSDNKICFGHSFALPYESGSATIARILQCNPTRSLDYVIQHCKQSLTDGLHLKNLTLTLKYDDYAILTLYFNKMKSNQISEYWSTGYDHCVQFNRKVHYRKFNCSQCAKAHYHSCMYDLPCVSHCPIHDEELTSHCPDCGNSWKKGIMQYNKVCSTCGLYKSLDDFMIQRKKLQGESFKKIAHWYDNCISLEPKEVAHFFDVNSSKGLVSSETLIDHKNTSILRSNICVCKTEYRIRESCHTFLTTKRFQLSKADANTLNNQVHDKSLSGTLLRLEKPLVKAKKMTLYKMYEYSCIDPTFFDNGGAEFHLNRKVDGSRYCEDFCIWLVLTTMPHSFKKICNDRKLHPYLFKNEISVLPEPPFPWQYVAYNNQIFRLSLSAQSFIYELQLLKFYFSLSSKLDIFTRLYFSDSDYRTSLAEKRIQKNFYKQFNMPPFFTIKNSSLYVTYFTHDFLSEPTLLNAKVKRRFRKLDKLLGIMLITDPDVSNPYDQFDTLVKEYSD